MSTLPIVPPVEARAPSIRMATDADAPAIGALFKAADYGDYGVDWDRAKVQGWWLVAEVNDDVADRRLVGAVQLLLAQPFGYLGEIVVHPDYRAREANGQGRPHQLGQVAWDLYTYAFTLMRMSGTEVVMGVVRDDMRGLHAILKRYGGQDLGRYAVFARRLRAVTQ